MTENRQETTQFTHSGKYTLEKVKENEKYSGASIQRPRKFFEKYNIAAQADGWNSATKAARLPIFLTGEALHYYIAEITDAEKTDFDTIQRKLEDKFNRPELNRVRINLFNALEMKPKETLEEWAGRVRESAEEAFGDNDLAMDMAVATFTKELQDEQLRFHLCMKEPPVASLQEALAIAVRFRELVQRERDYKRELRLKNYELYLEHERYYDKRDFRQREEGRDARDLSSGARGHRRHKHPEDNRYEEREDSPERKHADRNQESSYHRRESQNTEGYQSHRDHQEAQEEETCYTCGADGHCSYNCPHKEDNRNYRTTNRYTDSFQENSIEDEGVRRNTSLRYAGAIHVGACRVRIGASSRENPKPEDLGDPQETINKTITSTRTTEEPETTVKSAETSETEVLETPTDTLQLLEKTTVNTFKPAETPEAETAEEETDETATETITKSTADKEEKPKEPSTEDVHKLKEEVRKLKEEVRALKQTFTDFEIIEKQKSNPENSKTRPKQPPEEDKKPEHKTKACSEPKGATKVANFLTALLVIIIIAMSTVTGTSNVSSHGQCKNADKDAYSKIDGVTQMPSHQVYQRIRLQKELLHQKLLLHPPQEPESLLLPRERLKIQRGQRWRLRQQKGAQEEHISSKRQTRNSPKDSAYHYDNVDNCCINGRNSELRNYPSVPSQDKKKSKGEHGVLEHLFKERNCEGKPRPARDESHTRNLKFQKRKGRIKRRRIRQMPRSISFAERVVQKRLNNRRSPKCQHGLRLYRSRIIHHCIEEYRLFKLPILHRVMLRTNERTTPAGAEAENERPTKTTEPDNHLPRITERPTTPSATTSTQTTTTPSSTTIPIPTTPTEPTIEQ